jgi:hypothetical protein
MLLLILSLFTLLLRFLDEEKLVSGLVLVPFYFFLIWILWCSSSAWSGSAGHLAAFLAALLLLACWPAPSASLGVLVHWLLLLGPCAGTLWWAVLGVLERKWMVKWCWCVWGTAAGAGCVLIYYFCCVDSTWFACGDCAAHSGQTWFPLEQATAVYLCLSLVGLYSWCNHL